MRTEVLILFCCPLNLQHALWFYRCQRSRYVAASFPLTPQQKSQDGNPGSSLLTPIFKFKITNVQKDFLIP